MKFPVILAATVTLALIAGCGHIDVTPEGDPNRVLNGTVASQYALPSGAEVLVRIIDRTNRQASQPAPDLPVAGVARAPGMERIVAENTQTLAAASVEPVPFRLEYRADDATLRHGLNIDVRVSHGGKLRYRNLRAHVLTLGNSPYRQDVTVDPVAR
ncbi:MAG: hypothetical protein WD941_02795 [Opitutus sp.]